MAEHNATADQSETGQCGRPALPPTTELRHRSIGRPADQRELTGNGIRIEWPWTEHGRARTVITRSGAHRRYIVPCFRSGLREAHGDAPEERDAFILLDACAGVEFQEQPARILFEWRGTQHEHFPDILVLARTIKEFWECKKDRESLDLEVRRRTERLIELLAPLGFGYRLVTTSQLNQKQLIENAIRMRRRATLKVPDYVCRRIGNLGVDSPAVPAARLFCPSPDCDSNNQLLICRES